jgi:hypothetical protein
VAICLESNLATDLRVYDFVNLGIGDPGGKGCGNSRIWKPQNFVGNRRTVMAPGSHGVGPKKRRATWPGLFGEIDHGCQFFKANPTIDMEGHFASLGIGKFEGRGSKNP